MYINKLDDIVSKCNNTYHIEELEWNQAPKLTSINEIDNEDHHFKICDVIKYPNIKIFLQKAVSNLSEKVFVINKVKNTVL